MPDNLEDQLKTAGLSDADATKYANDFVTGLKELGLTDPETSAPVATLMQTGKSVANALTQMGVRTNLVKQYAAALDKAMAEYGVTSHNARAMFLAQLLHESAMLTAVIENLNYSELNLTKVFKNYFDRNSAKRYARQPQRIANRVYANRMGNGNEDSGDGFKYRGRGFIQLTGKENYVNCGKGLGVDLIKNPDYLTTPEGAARSAGWFWKNRNLNRSADAGDIVANTKTINGGLNGLEHRTMLYKKILPLV